MILVAGLGNPGKEYEGTRHNAGFMALDALRSHFGFSEFKLDKKSQSLVSEGVIGNQKFLLVGPQTFMNRSGNAIQSLSQFYKISPSDIIIIHDDIDIPLGELKVVSAPKGSGSAGHKGVASVMEALRIKNFTRIRVGIQPERGKPKNVESFVLKKFSKAELPLLESAIKQAQKILLTMTS